jgi:hypothetical protein
MLLLSSKLLLIKLTQVMVRQYILSEAPGQGPSVVQPLLLRGGIGQQV